MPMWLSVGKGFVKKKSQFGAEGNELENALTTQWLEPITNIKSKNAADKICSSLKEPAKAAFQNDSSAHTASSCSKTVHSVALWCCYRNEPFLWVTACDVLWVSWYFSMWLDHGACQQLTITLVICTEREKKSIYALLKQDNPGRFQRTCRAGWTTEQWVGGWELTQAFLYPQPWTQVPLPIWFLIS